MSDTTTTEPVLTEEQQKINVIREAHEDHIYDLTSQAIMECVAADLKYYDVAYISRRVVQILEETMRKTDFNLDYLTVALKGFFKDKFLEIKANATIGIFPEDSREAKCEPVAHRFLEMLMNEEFIEKDKEWLDAYIKATNEIFILNLVKHYFGQLSSKMDYAMEKTYDLCEKKLFGVEKPQLSLKEMDEICKRP